MRIIPTKIDVFQSVFGPAYIKKEAKTFNPSVKDVQNSVKKVKILSKGSKGPAKRKTTNYTKRTFVPYIACGRIHPSECYYIFFNRTFKWFKMKPLIQTKVEEMFRLNPNLKSKLEKIYFKRRKVRTAL